MIGPKNKSSKGRRNKRRAQSFRIAKATLATCPTCNELKLPHTICKMCGHYKKVEYIKKD